MCQVSVGELLLAILDQSIGNKDTNARYLVSVIQVARHTMEIVERDSIPEGLEKSVSDILFAVLCK